MDEVDHMVKIGGQRVARSSVVDAKTGVTRFDNIRTSYGGSFGMGEDPVLSAVEQKIAEWTHVPPGHGEPMQILRYQDGQQYDAHWDWFSDPKYFGNGDNRLATVLLYLSDVEEGGETALPLATAIDPEKQRLANPSPCAKKASGGISVVPHKGDALLFFDMDLTATTGQRSALHASCPTLRGTKWTATKWIHNKMHGVGFDPMKLASVCKDASDAAECKRRADAGECTAAGSDLIGGDGKCRKTCQDCIECPPDDIICQRANMRGRLHARHP